MKTVVIVLIGLVMTLMVNLTFAETSPSVDKANGVKYPHTQKPGFYLGLLVGYSMTDYQTITLENDTHAHDISDSGLAPNLLLGYQWTDYVASEFGIVYFAKPKLHNVYDADQTILTDKIKFKHNLIYLTSKLSVPLKYGVSLFIKLGIGYVVRDDIKINDTRILKGDEFLRPVYGAGMNWHVAQHWQLEAVWLQAPQNHSVRLPRSDFFAAGASYLF